MPDQPINIPEYMTDMFSKKSEGTPPQDRYYVIIPSGQQWNSLTPTQKNLWKDIVERLGENPEDYLHRMKQMFPQSPKGAK